MTARDARPDDDSPIQTYLQRLHARFAPLATGQVATYIPELAKADPDRFGIVIATVDGQVYAVGDTGVPFTIQSISKPFVYGVALHDHGVDEVRRRVGVEPSGDAFNSISLEPGTGRPLNPMINAGAIATSAMIVGESPEVRLQRLLTAMSALAGRPLTIDADVFESERSTGHRNRAIGHMLRNYGIVDGDPEPALALYFSQCSVVVDCRDLALMAATLANGGVHPLTAEPAVERAHIGAILSVMTTCGMYDFAGAWVDRVGMPAKSGVAGGVIAVLPGQLGIGVYSPRLDERGNSVRGVKVCEAISAELGLHFLQPPRPAAATIRSKYTLARVRSKRRRRDHESACLDREGHAALVFELQGDLRFSTVERVLREIARADHSGPLAFIVLDFKRVDHVDAAATTLLASLVERAGRRTQHVVFSRVRRDGMLTALGSEVAPPHAGAMSFQPALDAALEWCEYRLLAAHGCTHDADPLASFGEHQLCRGLTSEGVAELQRRLERRQYEPGSFVFRRGDDADALFLILRGEVSVVIPLDGGGVKRLATLAAGMSFGETALIDGRRRSADVRADSSVECDVLTRTALAALERDHPALAIRLLHNLLLGLTDITIRLTTEVSALEA